MRSALNRCRVVMRHAAGISGFSRGLDLRSEFGLHLYRKLEKLDKIWTMGGSNRNRGFPPSSPDCRRKADNFPLSRVKRGLPMSEHLAAHDRR
jgi:hypothetical protein